MKKILLLALMLVAVNTAFAKYVRFSVNMRGNPVDTGGVHVTGDFQDEAGYAGGDWITSSAMMTQDAMDTNVYYLVVNIPAFRHYEYKFVNGTQGYQQEFVPYESRVNYNFIDNRWIYIDSVSTDTFNIGTIRFGGNAPFGQYLMRFYVDMQNSTVDPSGTHVAGTFQNWNFGGTMMVSFDGLVHEHITYIDSTAASVVQDYRFVNGTTSAQLETLPGWCNPVNGNRTTTVPKDTLLPVVCFASCATCAEAGVADLYANKTISVYPNPMTSSTVLDLREAWKSISITDISGKEIRSIRYDGSSILRLDRSDLSPGVYMIRVVTGSDNNAVTRLVVE